MELRTLHLKIKPPSTACSCPLGRNDSALGFANLYSLTEKYWNADRARGRRALTCASSIASPASSRTIRRWARSISPTTCASPVREAQDEGRTPRLVGLSLEEKDRLGDRPAGCLLNSPSDRNSADYLYLSEDYRGLRGPGPGEEAPRRTSSSSCTAARRPSSPSPSTIWTSCAPTSRFGSRTKPPSRYRRAPSSWSIGRSCSI